MASFVELMTSGTSGFIQCPARASYYYLNSGVRAEKALMRTYVKLEALTSAGTKLEAN